MDNEILPDTQSKIGVEVYRVCENFHAIDTGRVSEDKLRKILVCSGGFEQQFEEGARTIDNLPCEFVLTAPNGTQFNETWQAKCGFNRDSAFRCPERRGPKRFKENNLRARLTWQDGMNITQCHHRSSVQYCPAIQDNFINQKAFADVLRSEWMTQGDNWSMVANNDR